MERPREDSMSHAGQLIQLTSEAGRTLIANLHRPSGQTLGGATVACGRAYHREKPLMQRAAQALAAAGLLTIRFDWGFFTDDREASPERRAEIAELDLVADHLRSQPGVTDLLLLGKSFGSVVSAHHANSHPDVKAVALLTPPIHAPGEPGKPWPGAEQLQAIDQPSLVICGGSDPWCNLTSLYRFCSQSRAAPRVVVVPGDHDLEDQGSSKSADSVDLAMAALATWTRRWFPGQVTEPSP